MSERIVVTGLGAVTPLGPSVAATWQGLIAGQSGIGPITLFDTSGFDVTIAGEVRDFKPESVLSPREVKRLDRFCQFALVAAREALDDSGLTINESNSADVG